MSLHGWCSCSWPLPCSTNFERGRTDVFDITAQDVGVIKSITLRVVGGAGGEADRWGVIGLAWGQGMDTPRPLVSRTPVGLLQAPALCLIRPPVLPTPPCAPPTPQTDAHSGWLLDSVAIISDGTGLKHTFSYKDWVPNSSTGDGSSVTLNDATGGKRAKDPLPPPSMKRTPPPPPPAPPAPKPAPAPPPAPAPAAAPPPAAPAPAPAAPPAVPKPVARMTPDQVAAAAASKPTPVVDPMADKDDEGATEPFDDATINDGLSSEF